MFKLNLLKYFRKYLIVTKEKINESKIEIKLSFVNSIFSVIKIFLIPNNETAPKIGIDIKKDIFAADTLSNFKSLAAVMPMPDLLTPGTRASICNIPIIIADFKVKSLLIFFSILNLSLTKRSMPNIIVVHAISSTLLIL